MSERTKPIPEKKIQLVKELSDLAKNKKTILIASIKNIPASQFQEIMKKLRGKAIIKVPKKNLIFKALDSSSEEKIKELKNYIHEDIAVLFSDLDAFELASELAENKTPAAAKAGQEAPEDIEIPAGPTDLPPGPAISELGEIGLQVQIEKGKISIKESKVIAKQGEKISPQVAAVMSKLEMKPFTIGFISLCAFDTQENKLYSEIKIDKEEAVENIKEAFAKAQGFAVSIGYISEDTIKFLLSKAAAHANKINRIINGEPEPETTPSKPAESSQEEEKEETKDEEEKAEEGASLSALFG